MTVQDGALGSILNIWPSNCPLNQDRKRRGGAELRQCYYLGLCEFRETLFSGRSGTQAQSHAALILEPRQGSGITG